MNFIVNLTASEGYFDLPQGILGWLLWFLFLGVNVYLLVRWRKYQREYTRVRRLILTLLSVLTPLTALFFGVRLPVGGALPAPGTPELPAGAVLMFFSAIPWVLASGLVGPTASGILALASGAILTYYDGHNLFIPLVYMLFGLLFGWFTLQPYRTLTYRLARVPGIVGLGMALVYPVIFVVVTALAARASVAVRLDYALSLLPGISVAFAGQLLMGVVFAQVIALVAPQVWRGQKEFEPSPAEASLEGGMVYRLAPLGGLFAFMVLVVIGIFVFNSNQQRLAVQMRNVADGSGASIPFSLETGQNLIVQMAEDERLIEAESSAQIEEILIEYLNQVPFFNQFTYLDSNKRLIAAYPRQDLNLIELTIEEQEAIDFALQGVSFQSYSLQPENIGDPARLAFIVEAQSPTGQTNILLGRTNLEQNPFFIPVLDNLESLTDIGGTAMLVDEEGMVLYHPDFSLIGTFYVGEIDLEVPQYDVRHTAADGTREILYVQPVPGRSWAIVTTMPIEVAQQLTLETTIPLFVLLVLLLVITFGILRLSVRSVIRSIGELADSATRVASGDLSQSLETERVDEVGQLANALEEMRLSLKVRMEEVERLLSVSKGVASSLEMDAAVNPILQGALSIGASSARLALAEAAVPEFEKNVRRHYGQGSSSDIYRNLDSQMLALVENQQSVELTNPSRARLQNFGNQMPGAVLAEGLVHENVHYGVLWIAFDEGHKFSEEERRFISAVAGQAALAASNARLYLSAQLGRNRMEAILDSTLEPMLVTDHRNLLLLVNPAAQNLLGKPIEALIGKPVEDIIEQKILRDLLVADDVDPGEESVEVTFPDKQVYFATASPVLVEGNKMGRVCLLRNITHYKELDAMKSEFVDTVNHDLRAPLTTMRGYATMLDMVGDLNEQQTRYVQKIVSGVENMSRLVNTLLDLGRIEAGVGLKLEKIPIADVVQQVAEALRVEAVQKQLDYQIQVPESTTPVIEADQALLERAIQNLIDNAIRYTPPEGKVLVSLQNDDEEYVTLQVSDTGVGVSPVDMPRLFERFYRGANRTTRSEKGSGLGLAIVKSIAERHHGTVTAESQLGKGSTFTLKIPVKQPEK